MKLAYSNPHPAPRPLASYPTDRLLQIVERRQFERAPEPLRAAVYQELDLRPTLRRAA